MCYNKFVHKKGEGRNHPVIALPLALINDLTFLNVNNIVNISRKKRLPSQGAACKRF